MKLADLITHHIEGIAREGSIPFRVPLFSHIDGNLWTGGCPVGSVPQEFEYIVSLYQEEPYKILKHQVYMQAQLFDAPMIPNESELYALAECVNNYRDRGVTLVHCQAGLNRSGLVAALSMIQMGMTPKNAIAILRNKRSPAVLCNKVFEEWLLTKNITR